MNRTSSAAIGGVLFFFASSLLCAGAQAGTQSPREDAGETQAHDVELIELMELDADWANPPDPATESRWQDSLPPAPPVTPREEKIWPRSEWLRVTPTKAPDRRCDPGLDALFSKECSKEPTWLGSPKSEEKIWPRGEWFRVTPMKAPNRHCDPGLDALFLSKECSKEPSWLESPRK